MAPKEARPDPAVQEQQVMHMNPRIEKDRQMILDAQKKGTGAVFKTYVKLSGPGWLQSGPWAAVRCLRVFTSACWWASALCGSSRWR